MFLSELYFQPVMALFRAKTSHPVSIIFILSYFYLMLIVFFIFPSCNISTGSTDPCSPLEMHSLSHHSTQLVTLLCSLTIHLAQPEALLSTCHCHSYWPATCASLPLPLSLMPIQYTVYSLPSLTTVAVARLLDHENESPVMV